jgi:membrane protein YdbS with pleckstrin-like domain
VQSQARRDAVTVEIVYAVLPSVLLVLAAVVAGLVTAWAFDLRGTSWGVAGAAAFILVAVAALTRTVLVLLHARRRGL